MALAVRLRADPQLDAAVVLHLQARGLLAVGAADLAVAGKSEAAQLAFCRRLFAPRLKSWVVDRGKAALQHSRKVAAVVGLAEGGGVGQGLRRHEVAQAPLLWREAAVERRRGDQSLDQVGRLPPPGAPGCPERPRVWDSSEEGAVGKR